MKFVDHLAAHQADTPGEKLGPEATAELAAAHRRAVAEVALDLDQTLFMTAEARDDLLHGRGYTTKAVAAGYSALQKAMVANLRLAHFYARESVGTSEVFKRSRVGTSSRPRASGPDSKPFADFGSLKGLMLPGADIDDRMQNASLGMVRAFGNWDWTVMLDFGPFAGIYIHNALIRYIARPYIVEYNGPRVPIHVIDTYLAARKKYETIDLYEAARAVEGGSEEEIYAERERLRGLEDTHRSRYAYFLADLAFSADHIKEEITEWSFVRNPTVPPEPERVTALRKPSGEERAATEEENIEAAWSVQVTDQPPQLADLLADPGISVEDAAEQNLIRESLVRIVAYAVWSIHDEYKTRNEQNRENAYRNVGMLCRHLGLLGGEPTTQETAAKEIGVTPKRISQIKLKLLKRLRQPPYVDSLRDIFYGS